MVRERRLELTRPARFRNIELFADITRAQTGANLPGKHREDREPGFLPQRAERRNCIVTFHVHGFFAYDTPPLGSSRTSIIGGF